MTLAQMTVQRDALIAELRGRIRDVLQQDGHPAGAMSLATIEAYLKKRKLDAGEPLGRENTFDVRNAVSEMVEDGEAEYTIGREVRLLAR